MDNSDVRNVRHGASFFKMAHINFCDAPQWRTLNCYGASKSWCAKKLLKIAETAIAKDDLGEDFLALPRETDFR